MLQSAGYNPAVLPDRRIRLLLLSRLVPLVERNVNLLELGPRQTGKTFLLRNVSPRVFTISGGKTTPANLFVNLSTKQVGIVGTRKVVVFDEIAHTTFDGDETISTLKDFMESGQFSRGSLAFAADAGLVFTGNIDVEGNQPHPKYRNLLEPLPKELVDSAFQDRMHAYLPGWEVPKIGPDTVSRGVGFVTDYFGEALVRLRDDSHTDRIRSVALTENLTKRDHTAVERLGSGLIKLLYPDGNVTDDELREIVMIACEYRQRVHDQLVKLAPGEFRPKSIAPAGVDSHAAPDLKVRPIVPEVVDDRLNREAVVGAVTGLAVLHREQQEVGGDTILIQVSCFAGSATVQVTGMHGPVLRLGADGLQHRACPLPRRAGQRKALEGPDRRRPPRAHRRAKGRAIRGPCVCDRHRVGADGSSREARLRNDRRGGPARRGRPRRRHPAQDPGGGTGGAEDRARPPGERGGSTSRSRRGWHRSAAGGDNRGGAGALSSGVGDTSAKLVVQVRGITFRCCAAGHAQDRNLMPRQPAKIAFLLHSWHNIPMLCGWTCTRSESYATLTAKVAFLLHSWHNIPMLCGSAKHKIGILCHVNTLNPSPLTLLEYACRFLSKKSSA